MLPTNLNLHSDNNGLQERRQSTQAVNRFVFKVPPLWQLIVAMLNVHEVDYTPTNLAPLFGLKPHTIRKYCLALWPDYPGHYRLDFDHTAVLVHRLCRDSDRVKSVLSAEDLYKQMRLGEMVSPVFPNDCENVKRALVAIQKYREEQQQNSENGGAQQAA